MSDAAIVAYYLIENGFDAYALDGSEAYVKITVSDRCCSVQVWPGKYVECCKFMGDPVQRFQLPRIESPTYVEELRVLLTKVAKALA